MNPCFTIEGLQPQGFVKLSLWEEALGDIFGSAPSLPLKNDAINGSALLSVSGHLPLCSLQIVVLFVERNGAGKSLLAF